MMTDNRVPPWWDRTIDQLARECRVVTVSFSHPIGDHVPCHYCGEDASSRDHIVAESVHGVNNWWNLVPACEPCNQSKQDRQACACMYCLRAMALWSLGYRREGITRGKKERARLKRRRAQQWLSANVEPI